MPPPLKKVNFARVRAVDMASTLKTWWRKHFWTNSSAPLPTVTRVRVDRLGTWLLHTLHTHEYDFELKRTRVIRVIYFDNISTRGFFVLQSSTLYAWNVLFICATTVVRSESQRWTTLYVQRETGLRATYVRELLEVSAACSLNSYSSSVATNLLSIYSL